MRTKHLCVTHHLTLVYLSLKFNKICSSYFCVIVDITRDEPIIYECDLDLGCKNLNFVLHTHSQYALKLCEI